MSAGAFERALASLEADQAVDIAETYAAIEAAAKDGDPRAALLAAYAAGVGYGRDIDINAAFGWLKTAAESGEPRARAQLEIISRSGINDWISARPTRGVSERPSIGMCSGFLDPLLCAWIIERAAPLQESSYVYDPKTGRPVVDDARTNSAATFKLPDLDLPLILIRHRIANTLGVPVEHFERTSVFRYRVGQTFADHADYISTSFSAEIRQRGQRPWTFLIYLNDAFEGGETHFLVIDKKVRGGVGDALFFRNVDDNGVPDEQSQHAGTPPASGEKWLLSQFVRDKPQVPG